MLVVVFSISGYYFSSSDHTCISISVATIQASSKYKHADQFTAIPCCSNDAINGTKGFCLLQFVRKTIDRASFSLILGDSLYQYTCVTVASMPISNCYLVDRCSALYNDIFLAVGKAQSIVAFCSFSRRLACAIK